MEKYSKKCRLCAEETESHMNVLDIADLIEDIKYFTTVHIKEGDHLPTVICLDCNYNIAAFSEYREKCIAVQQIFEMNIIKKDEPELFDDNPICITEITEQATPASGDDDDYVLIKFIDEIESDEFEEKFIIDVDSKSLSLEIIGNEDIQDFKTETNNKEIDDGLILISDDSNIEEEEEEAEILKIRNGKSQTQSQLKAAQEICKSLLEPCDICWKMIEKNRLMDHRNHHLDIRPYVCEIGNCKKSFHSSFSLEHHNRDYHTPTTCDICGKPYNNRKSLYNHREKHKTPQHQCKFCGQLYKTIGYLKQHVRIHTGERPYACQLCPKAFTTSFNLKVHIRSHTKENPLKCKYCDSAYRYNRGLKKHIKEFHSDKIV